MSLAWFVVPAQMTLEFLRLVAQACPPTLSDLCETLVPSDDVIWGVAAAMLRRGRTIRAVPRCLFSHPVGGSTH